MAAVTISLLALTVVGVLRPPPRLANWVPPLLGAGVLLVLGGISPAAAVDAVRPLVEPLAFLLLAVPLAVMLDRIGFFASVAALVDSARNPVLGLWVLAAAVTTFLNLDASVVLLTPLYIRIARRHGLDPTLLALQPVILASLASSALPISNLTNLIASSRYDLGVADFLARLGPASLIAVVVGWLCYRRIGAVKGATERIRDTVDSRALLIGTPIVAFVVLGFTVGDVLGVPAWLVALVADVPLLALTRLRGRTLAIAEIPFGAAALAVGLGVIASAAAPHLGIDAIFHGNGPAAELRVAGAAILGAVTINNLPALLIGLAPADHARQLIWPLLFGVNFGPVLILHGSLAGLLWHSTAARLDVEVSALEYTRFGVRIGLPALLAGLGTLVATSAIAR